MLHICVFCCALFIPDNKAGRPSRYCGKACASRDYERQRVGRRIASKTMSCASCGGDMWRTHSSLPEGQARCQACRRAAWGLLPHERVNDFKAAKRAARGPCEWCRAVVPETPRYRYCSETCAAAARVAKGHGFSRARKSGRERGYGAEHQKLRAELLPTAYGKPCHLCGDVMEEGDDLHLDHTPDRAGYRGFAHALCNYRDGARRGRQKQLERSLREGWRPGQDPGTRRRPTRSAAR